MTKNQNRLFPAWHLYNSIREEENLQVTRRRREKARGQVTTRPRAAAALPPRSLKRWQSRRHLATVWNCPSIFTSTLPLISYSSALFPHEHVAPPTPSSPPATSPVAPPPAPGRGATPPASLRLVGAPTPGGCRAAFRGVAAPHPLLGSAGGQGGQRPGAEPATC